MADVGLNAGRATPVDAAVLERELGVPVVPVVARTGEGFDRLKQALLTPRRAGRLWRMNSEGERAIDVVRAALDADGLIPEEAREAEAIRLLCHARDADRFLERASDDVRTAVRSAREALEEAAIDREAVEAEYRYALCQRIAHAAHGNREKRDRSQGIDRLLTHRVLGPVLYVLIMGVIFQAVYTWAVPFMDWIDAATGWAGEGIRGALGEGMFTDLLVDGVLAGVGGIVIFLPQICLLFLFLTLLEDMRLPRARRVHRGPRDARRQD